MAAGSTLAVVGSVDSSGATSIAAGGTLSATGFNQTAGTLQLNGGTLAATLQNAGLVQGAGTIGTGSATSVSNVGGTISANTSGQTLTINAGTVSNQGTIQVASGSTLSLANASGSNTNFGTVLVSSGGTLELASGALYSQSAGMTTVLGSLGGAGSRIGINGGTLQGTGTVTSATTIGSGGTLLAGNGAAPGTLTVGALTINGTLGLNATSGTSYGVVNVTGTGAGAFTIGSGSTLNLTTLDALNLAVGSSLTIATSGSAVAGTFANITGQSFHGGTEGWHVLYNQGGDNIELTAVSTANLAQASAATPNPIAFGNVHVGATAPSQALSISNTATPPSEGLNGSIATSTAGLTAAGTFTSLAAGSTSTALTVGMNTATAGTRNGTATITLASDGSFNGGVQTALPSQTINVTGGVYQYAQPSLATAVNLGNFHVGSGQPTSLSQAVAISNSSVAPAGFQEGLDVATGATTGQGTISGGPITNLGAGGSASTISVGLSGLTAGVNAGTATVALTSDGATTSGLGTTSLGNATVDVTGTGYNLASGSTTPTPVTIANQRVGGTMSQVLTVANNAPSGSFTEVLNAGFGANTGAATNNGGSISGGLGSGLAGGASNNTAMSVGVNTSAAGAQTGTVTLTYASNGTGTSGLGNTSVGSQTITVTGGVYETAQPSLSSTVNFGNFHVGSGQPTSLSQAVAISNPYAIGVPTGFQEGLDVATAATSGQGTISGGPITNLAAGAGASTAISVGLTGLTAGANSGTATLALATDGATTSGLTAQSLGSTIINVSGTGYNLASGATTPSPVTIGNQRVGGTGSQVLTVANNAPSGGFTEVLNAGFGSNTGAATNNGGAISGGLGSGVAGGASNDTAMSVGVNTATAGAQTGTVTLNYVSNGAGTSGLGTTSVGSQTITVSGGVYQAAAGAITTTPLNFGVVQVGQTVSQTLAVQNVATGAAGFVEDLNASFGSTSGTGSSLISGTGAVSGLTAGNIDSSHMTVTVNTASAGTVNGAIGVNFFTAGTVNGVSDGLGVALVGSASYGVSGTIQTTGTVINDAAPVINNSPISLGNAHVGASSPVGFVSLTNQATSAPQASLNASITGNAPITASGTVTDLGPGGMDNTHLQVGMNTSAAGAINGTATLGLVSDAGPAGCTSNCLLTLASQNVAVTGGVYQYAQPSVASTVNLGNVRVGARRPARSG